MDPDLEHLISASLQLDAEQYVTTWNTKASTPWVRISPWLGILTGDLERALAIIGFSPGMWKTEKLKCIHHILNHCIWSSKSSRSSLVEVSWVVCG